MTRQETLRVCTATRQHIFQLQPNNMITFNFGYPIKAAAARRQMVQFFNAAQDNAFGRDWASQRDRDWPVAYGFLEHPNSNPHYHVLAKLDATLSRAARMNGPDLWETITSRGQLHVQTIKALDRAINYCTKDLHRAGRYEEMFIYCDTRSV